MKRERDADAATATATADAATAATTDREVVKRAVFERPRLGLLDLPFDLLDEISHYLKRGDAAKCLTVCSTLHGAFARRVWRNIERLPPKRHSAFPIYALDRYGHLVRYVYISYRRAKLVPLKSICNVTRLEMCSGCLESVLGNEDIHELARLQRIDVIGNPKDPNVELAESVNCFSSRANARGQLVAFRWTWTVSSREEYRLLSQMAAKLANVSQHSFELTIQRRDMASHAEMMPLFPVISNLNLECYQPRRGSIVIKENDTFPRLAHLSITADSDCFPGRKGAELTPRRLPALQYLRISYTKGCSSAVEPMFDHTWSTVTKFDLGFCDNAAFFDRIVRQLPNVTELEISRSYFPVDIHAIATHMPRLQTLQVVISEKALAPRLADGAVFANLIKFGLKYSMFGKDVIRPEWLSLMLDCAPNLREVQIKDYSLANAVLRKFAGRTNPSVRSLEVMPWHGSKKKVDALADIDTWMAFFPSTKMIEVPCDGIVDLSGVKRRCPNTLIIIKRI